MIGRASAREVARLTAATGLTRKSDAPVSAWDLAGHVLHQHRREPRGADRGEHDHEDARPLEHPTDAPLAAPS